MGEGKSQGTSHTFMSQDRVLAWTASNVNTTPEAEITPKSSLSLKILLHSKLLISFSRVVFVKNFFFTFTVAVDEEQQCTSHGSIKRTDRVGLLATLITEEYGWGGSACPWVLRVPPGQRINITLFNFARTGGSELLTSDPSVCYELASIREKGHSSKTILTCGTDQRQKNVYISETNEIEIRFVDRLTLRNLGKFLVQHEGKYYHTSTRILSFIWCLEENKIFDVIYHSPYSYFSIRMSKNKSASRSMAEKWWTNSLHSL